MLNTYMTKSNRPNLIATANTTGGWAIGIISDTSKGTRKGTFYSVIRMDRESTYVTLSTHWNESDARKAANAAWKLDTGRGPAMIY